MNYEGCNLHLTFIVVFGRKIIFDNNIRNIIPNSLKYDK